MARHDKNDGQPQRSFEALEEQSKRLADDFDIPKGRVLACLASLVAVLRADGSQHGEPTRWVADLIRDAVSTLGEDEGIRFLEQTDPLRLKRRIQAVEYLRSESVPFSSLDELRDQLRSFLEFQDEIEQFLVKTGLPPKTFDESPWLSLHLGRLYDTRCTRSPYPRRPSSPTYRQGHGPLDDSPEQVDSSTLPTKEPYVWVKHLTESVFTLDEIKQCEQEDADFLPGLNSEDAKQLEVQRPRVWAARRAVIAEVVQACERREGEGLLERCLEILEAKLDRATILFLLRMDGFYLGGDPRTREQVETTPKMSPGGLTNLVEVIGHVEDELRSRRIDCLKRSIPKNTIGTVFDDEDASAGYLKSTRTAEAGAVDSALDEFSERAEKSRRHWRDVCHRFTKWLDPDYRVPLYAEVQPEFAEHVASLLPTIIAHLESRIKAGKCPASLPEFGTPNQFRYDGSSWSFGFDGKTTAQPHLDGFFYLAELLKAPKQDIYALELRLRITTWKAHGSNVLGREQVLIAKGDPDGRSPDALRIAAGDAGPSSDAQALAKYQAELAVVKQRLASAEGAGRAEEVAELQEEQDTLQEHIDTNTNDRGQPRRLQSERKKAGDAVRKAIDTAIERLLKSHPSLHGHLALYVEHGSTCRYTPPTAIDWEF